MLIIPSIFGGQRSNVFYPFSLDIWDPFQDFPFTSALTTPQFSIDAAALANACIDWKGTPKAHVFKADLPGFKEKVKVDWRNLTNQCRGGRDSCLSVSFVGNQEKNGPDWQLLLQFRR
uniref:SHSP domain-containing protein n=1 Tax=Nelumbo nucifera TaxID=4432 RepID=A0A822Y5B8_NELNU|nr:TPA_asm: hypothetical protein HUJ06_027872 [Nelumbo nucifera]DAD26406.1 TPA_asm: hypothetical protein HUJ06_027874 [Nelumbo nucifera]